MGKLVCDTVRAEGLVDAAAGLEEALLALLTLPVVVVVLLLLTLFAGGEYGGMGSPLETVV